MDDTPLQEDAADPQPNTSHVSHIAWLIWIPVILLLYVLSTGPVILLASQFPTGSRATRAIEYLYAPIGVSYNHCRPLARALDWYLALWGVP